MDGLYRCGKEALETWIDSIRTLIYSKKHDRNLLRDFRNVENARSGVVGAITGRLRYGTWHCNLRVRLQHHIPLEVAIIG
jgi:hypothetical protein